MLGGSRGGLSRARPQQSVRGCDRVSLGAGWGSPGNVLMDLESLRRRGVVPAAEHHHSWRAKSVRPSRDPDGKVTPYPSIWDPSGSRLGRTDFARQERWGSVARTTPRRRKHSKSIRTFPGEYQGHSQPLCCGLAQPKRPREPHNIFEDFFS